MRNANAAAFAAEAIAAAGVEIEIQRISGFSPNTVAFSAKVRAIVRNVLADTQEQAQTGYSGSQAGSISQDDRQVILLEDDLRGARFPLPVRKNDRVNVADTSESFNVTKVDPYKRAVAGAIELIITGVS